MENSIENRRVNLTDYHSIMDNDIMLSYKGPFNSTILSIIGKYIESFFVINPLASKKLFKIFIELAQNIAFYSNEKSKGDDEDARIGTIAIGESKDFYSLATGNIVKNEDIISVIEKCEFINSLDRDGLRKYKIEERKLALGRNRGSHIGLIQVALTSAQPLDIEVAPIDDNTSFFTISVKINKF